MMFVYPIGTGSKYDNFELRYSLRALEANFKGPIEITLIGELPKWIRGPNVNQSGPNLIAFTENPADNAVENTSKKLLAVLPFMPEEFVWMNDDFYLLRPRTDIPVHHGGFMEDRIAKITRKNKSGAKTMYLRTFINTFKILKAQGIKDPIRYDIHTPFTLHRDRVVNLAKIYDFTQHRFKSLYGNVFGIGGVKYRDVKGSIPGRDMEFYSTRSVIPPVTKAFFEARFPVPSRFEAW